MNNLSVISEFVNTEGTFLFQGKKKKPQHSARPIFSSLLYCYIKRKKFNELLFCILSI